MSDRVRARLRRFWKPAQGPIPPAPAARERFVVFLAEPRRGIARRRVLVAAVIAVCVTGFSGLLASEAFRRGGLHEGEAASVSPNGPPITTGDNARGLAPARGSEPSASAMAVPSAPAGGNEASPPVFAADELPGLRRDFDKFLNRSGHRRKRLTDQQRAALFQQYLQWRANSSTVREAARP